MVSRAAFTSSTMRDRSHALPVASITTRMRGITAAPTSPGSMDMCRGSGSGIFACRTPTSELTWNRRIGTGSAPAPDCAAALGVVVFLPRNCVENFTYDQVLPYLLKKPTCTKYSSPWIASPLKEQNKYIEQLKSSDPTFIIYKSGKGHLDSIPMSERLHQVNKYILYKYEPFQVFDIYVIYKKKN